MCASRQRLLIAVGSIVQGGKIDRGTATSKDMCETFEPQSTWLTTGAPPYTTTARRPVWYVNLRASS